MSTPHLDARPGDIADTVLLPGDPLRARHIAREFLNDVAEVNTRRNMLGYTGHYHAMRVSVLGSGMGIPSCAIYATELARVFGVKRVVRVGTCGGVGDVAVGDLLLAQAASTDSNFNRRRFGGHDLSVSADFGLMCAVAEHAAAKGIDLRITSVFSTDNFYADDPDLVAQLLQHKILGVEMESAGLYAVAMREGFRTLTVLTVSDHLQHDTHMPPMEREQGLSRMTALVLDSLLPGAATPTSRSASEEVPG